MPHSLPQTINGKGSHLQNVCLFVCTAVHLTTSLDETEPNEIYTVMVYVPNY